MNERFKFRIWCVNKNQWETGKVYLDNEGRIYDDFHRVKEETHIIQQCTGLKDRNGKLIYEGDLLKTRFGLILKVYWREQSAMFWLETLDGVIPFTFYAKQQLDGDSMEVIGNIYENKELLEEQK
jgi:uncharacterized phage protein (TIGR01671 family)